MEKIKNIKEYLDSQVAIFESVAFIADDPIRIPHMYSAKEDIEISGFLTALISWGRRSAIVETAGRMLRLMHNRPYDFIMYSREKEKAALSNFVYRTFNADDLLFLLEALKNIYRDKGGLEGVFMSGYGEKKEVKDGIVAIRQELLKTEHLYRSQKHLANPHKGSAAKRFNMFLRWMVRSPEKGVDFGLWKDVSTEDLMIPLDVHSGNTARRLGLLQRKQNDWKAVEELTGVLKTFDPGDPVKYDYALFGTGINGLI